ncbi:MAG: murein biosynthesis integral membrane protein MurJ [Candidatus Microgenomates bacterium]|jgi:putative peptidoglycan lipid II flippase
MVDRLVERGKKLFFSKQNTVLSAAALIMIMIVASRVLGLVRQRVLANFFNADILSLFFAAFRLPDTLFEVLVFGTFSSAFVPVFTKSLKIGRKQAWETAAYVTNIGLIIFAIFALLIIIFANQLYGVLAPGYPEVDRGQIVILTRVIFAAQGFFVVSYVLTGVLESLRRFLIPALAPLLYNIGIILGTVLFAKQLGIMAPAIGVVIGAASHFAIQLPLATRLGFRFKGKIKLTPEVKNIAKLAFPRLIEVSFLQVTKTVELFLSSFISTAAYTYLTFGNTLQLLPVGLFGTSIAKAALPTLSRQTDNMKEFKKTLFNSLNQMSFFVAPVATALLVLRIPVIRLVYGTAIFSWESTVQTSLVLSAFALSVVFQTANSLLARGFYAMHDTKTPVIISICSIVLNVVADFVMIRVLRVDVWGLAAGFSIASFIQTVILFITLNNRISDRETLKNLLPTVKITVASLISGGAMYFVLKFFDEWAWIRKLSFLGKVGAFESIHFEKFVLDTRYTVNLMILTAFVVFVGFVFYILVSFLLKSKELTYFIYMIRRALTHKKNIPPMQKELEPITPTTSDTGSE